ncbi:MAG TPA: Na+/H+ antiporter NhaA [Solirubrobacteraceae bacterium]|nr:Na+/H+ antiporter NhaA [Solirubrobacteraceae bacterium]
MAEATTTPLTGRTAWARNLAAPVRDFLSTETGSAIVLLAATVAALVWANSPWPDSYESLWGTELSFRLGDWALSADLREWVNDGLMTFFFLVVGLEAKRELDLGELRDRKRLALPVVAALGGMIVPVAIFVALNAGGSGGDGWGAAMSTDTAFALGLLALAAPRGATRLRVFLLTLAVVDDLGALLVIATAYSEDVSLIALSVAIGLFGVLVALRFAPVGRSAAAAAVGVAIWVAMFKSGIHPTIAGLAIGLVTSAYPPARGDLERASESFRSFREQPTPELARTAQLNLVSAISANERLQYRLHPWTSYAIVPLFALANAGITFSGGLLGDALRSPVTLGIVIGYVVGKPAGIVGASWLATRRMFGGQRLPVSWPGLGGIGAVAGIGFTVSLLISTLAFRGQLLEEAKIGILAGAVLSALSAWAAFRAIALIPASTRARQLRGTADELLDLADDVDPDIDHLRGRHDAPVMLLEYGDYECPYCSQAETVVRELLDSFGDDLCYVWRHLPLSDVHPRAQMAAEVAEAAGAQGRFWDMHDMLLSHQDELLPMQIRSHAEELGLDLDRLWDDVHRRAYAPRIARDVASADESGVSGTPTFFINGRRHQGAYDSATLTSEVRAARGALSTGQSSKRR